MQPPPGAPVSEHFTIEEFSTAGRGIYACKKISAGIHIFTANDLDVSLMQREYRREVCGQCFFYDRGRNLSVRDHTYGFSFCSVECQDKWKDQDDIALAAWAEIERLIKNRSKEDEDLVDANSPRPSPSEIKTAWLSVQKQADLIREARDGTKSKQHRKALREATAKPVPADTLPLQLATLLVRRKSPEVWRGIRSLAADPQPYKSYEELTSHLNSYLHLLTVLPEELLKWALPEYFHTLLTRDCFNSFGIRSLEDGGDEYFGFGVWPSASYFNHSCVPNVLKKREARKWVFTAGRDIEQGEELCITYLSGEEREMSRGRRMERLRKAWGFECACDKCGDV